MTVGSVALLVAGLVVEGVPQLVSRAAPILVWLAVVNTALVRVPNGGFVTQAEAMTRGTSRVLRRSARLP